MEFSQKGIDLLKKLEGFNEFPKRDVNGKWIIGYGTTIGLNAKCEPTISQVNEEEATKLLMDCVNPILAAFTRIIAVPINQNQTDALVCFVYNIGLGAFEESTLLKLLNKSKYDDAAKQFGRWVSIKGIANKGLQNRRKQEEDLFSSKF